MNSLITQQNNRMERNINDCKVIIGNRMNSCGMDLLRQTTTNRIHRVLRHVM